MTDTDRIALLQTRVTELLAEREKLREMLEQLELICTDTMQQLQNHGGAFKHAERHQQLLKARALLDTTQDGGDGDENL